MASTPRRLTYQGIPIWRHAQIIQWTTQIVSGIVVVALVVWFFANIGAAVQGRDIPHGFGFLDRAYSTPIGHHFIPYEPSDSFQYSLWVGFSNTLVVSIIGVILATVLGILVGVARLSSNWIVSRAALVYVEFFRNVPLLVQLFFWFYIVLILPPVLEGYVIGDKLYINNAGVWIPMIDPSSSASSSVWLALGVAGMLVGATAAAMLMGMAVHRRRSRLETGAELRGAPTLMGAACLVIVGIVVALAVGVSMGWGPFDVSHPAALDLVGRRPGGIIILIVLVLSAVLVGQVVYRWLTWRETVTGSTSYPTVSGIAAAVVIGAIYWVAVSFLAGGAPFGVSHPAPEGAFGRIGGGFDIVAGLIALLVGLVIYTSSFIAEIVRAGVQSVGKGQIEAGRSVGLSGSKTLRHVTFPQALPVIVPPLISQWLNLTKNSSLAGAIGYSDLTNIGKTMTQTAPAISIFIIIMVAYLAISLAYSLIGNLYNRSLRY